MNRALRTHHASTCRTYRTRHTRPRHPVLQLRLPEPHPPQRPVMRTAQRFRVVVCGRRFGKTTLGIVRLLERAVDGQPVSWCSPTYKMLAEPWRELHQTLAPLTRRISRQQHRIDLITGGSVECWSLDQPDSIRGRKYARIVIDEAAMTRRLRDAWQAVIRPTLADLQGDAWFLSSPRGRNFFWECWQHGHCGDLAKWRSWRIPTSVNPYIPNDEISSANHELPEQIFEQEYLAKFLDMHSGIFRRIRESATSIPQESALPDHQYVIGVDWARMHDFTAFVVVDATLSAIVAIDRFKQVEYAIQVSRLKALCKRFQPLLILAEQNSMGGPLVEQLAREGLPIRGFSMTVASKTMLVDSFALALERGMIQLLDDPILIAELQAYESERLPGGMMRYNAPSGEHDDTVIAAMLAWHAAQRPAPRRMVEFL